MSCQLVGKFERVDTGEDVHDHLLKEGKTEARVCLENCVFRAGRADVGRNTHSRVRLALIRVNGCWGQCSRLTSIMVSNKGYTNIGEMTSQG